MACGELKACKHLHQCKPISHNASAKQRKRKATDRRHDEFTIQGKVHTPNKHWWRYIKSRCLEICQVVSNWGMSFLEKWNCGSVEKMWKCAETWGSTIRKKLIQGPSLVQHVTDLWFLGKNINRVTIFSWGSQKMLLFTFHFHRHNYTSQRPVTDFSNTYVKCDYFSTGNKTCASQSRTCNAP